MKVNYKYEILESGVRQYDDCDLKERNCVVAKYIKSCCPIDNGNPYIEALPLPRDGEEVFHVYTKTLNDFDRAEIEKMTNLQKQVSVISLRKVRVVLPFHQILEQDFYLMLVQSYRSREKRVFDAGGISIVQNNTECDVEMSLRGNPSASANAGCTMLGYSGCGKSSALEILLSNYPQVIEHHTVNIARFTQIVYLTVVCPTNSNFSTLYVNIGAEIDSALGNTIPVYETMIRRCKTLGEKADKVCKLISLFGIGCIIFDEIQLIDFKSTKENSFESLLTIVNKTKVALFAVGTEDAYRHMFPNIRTSRRIGTMIMAHQYCNNKKFFANIVSFLMQYQWFDEIVQPTEPFIDALYKVTKGIVDQLITVYMYMQIDYLRAVKKPVVNEKYVTKVAKKYFPGMQELLSMMEDPKAEAERMALMKQSQEKLAQEVRDRQMAENLNQIVEYQGSDEGRLALVNKTNIIKDIKKTLSITGEEYNDDKIEKAVISVMKDKRNSGCGEEILANKAYQRLKKMISDKRSNTPKNKNNITQCQLRELIEKSTTLIEIE